MNHEVKEASEVMFKQPQIFRATAPGKFLMMAGAAVAREEACHYMRTTSAARKEVRDPLHGPL